ncbi:MAG TPA: DUF4915 domain-containing protein, partial [Planctomycetota bacterium]|nr:DUF4915 domain-containing protein [Planctomycetota bacterium]
AAPSGRGEVTHAALPHPSGLAPDRHSGGFHVACTRNPNLLLEFRTVKEGPYRGFLAPSRARFLPGRLYLHDLAWIGGRLCGNAVGENAVLRLRYDAPPERIWWPRSIEHRGRPDLSRNTLQLNSIAAGRGLSDSYFSASCERPGGPPPGDPAFDVDGRGVLFSGRTREPAVRGLTRPHSARQAGGRVWVDNSGYGEVGFVQEGRFISVARLPGWTRGLAVAGRVAFVGTSAVLRRFASYAPGLEPDRCVCGIHAIDLSTGRRIASVVWPYGNQIFAIEAVPQDSSRGFPEATRDLYFSFQVV